MVANPENSIENDLPDVTYEPNLESALKMLSLLYQINSNQRSQRVSYEIFYLPDLMESINLQKDYVRWSQCKVSVYSLMQAKINNKQPSLFM